MREAIGGSQLLLIVVTLIIVIMMLLAGSVGYTKAFKARNAIINLVQENGGYGISASGVLANAEDEIDALLTEMGYKEVIGTRLQCTTNDFPNKNIEVLDAARGRNYNFCVYQFEELDTGNRYYGVKTFMYFELPIFGRTDAFVFPIYGDTYTFFKVQ